MKTTPSVPHHARSSLSLFSLLALCTLPLGVQAQLISNSPLLPPAGAYVSPEEYHNYSVLGVVIDNPIHSGFSSPILTPVGNNELEQFDSQFQGMLLQAGTLAPIGPVQGSGPTRILTLDRLTSLTGTFQTEMLSMDLVGTTPLGPAMIRESPTLQSLGQTTITDIGGGLYRIDSFFDVFTEVSIDGGNTWLPSSGSTRMTLVPEPSTYALASLGLGLCLWWRSRRTASRG